MSENNNRISRNAAALFVGQIVTNLSMFLLYLVVSREFGADGFGNLTLGLMIATVGATVAGLGFRNGITNFISRSQSKGNRKQIGQFVSTSVLTVCLSSVVLTITVYFGSDFLATTVFGGDVEGDVFRVFSVAIPALVLVQLLGGVYLGFQEAQFKTLFEQAAPRVLFLIITVGVIVAGGSIIDVSLTYSVAVWISAVAGVGLLIKLRGWDLMFRPGVDEFRELADFSLPLLFSTTTLRLLIWTDTFLVGVFLASDAVGIYQSAYVLASNIMIFLGAVAPSLYPVFSSKLQAKSYDSIRSVYREYTRRVAIVTAPVGVYLAVFNSHSLGVLYGSEFAAGGIPLAIMTIGRLTGVSFGPTKALNKSLGNTRQILILNAIAFVINLLLNILLIPLIGLAGAAIATVVSDVSIGVVLYVYARNAVSVRIPVVEILGALGMAVLISIPFALVDQWVNSVATLIAHSGLFAVIYFAGLYPTRMITEKDVSQIQNRVTQMLAILRRSGIQS